MAISGMSLKGKLGIIGILVLILIIIQVQFDIVDDIRRYFVGVEKDVYLEEKDIGRWYKHEVEKYVEELAEQEYEPYRDAYFDPETDEIVPEKLGKKVLIKETVEKAMEAPPESKVEVKYLPLYPLITKEFLSSIDEPMASFATGLGGGGGEGRITNIEISSQDVNNTLLFPGQIFSFNRATLPRTWERGYRYAPILVNDTAMGIGGGVCQVSSTIYNVALEADLEIVERHPHGSPVDYVPPGRDATVAGDYLDLKFKNDTEHVLLLTAHVSQGLVKVDLYKSQEPFALTVMRPVPLAFNNN